MAVACYWAVYCLYLANYVSVHLMSLPPQADQIFAMSHSNMVARHDASDSTLARSYWAAVWWFSVLLRALTCLSR